MGRKYIRPARVCVLCAVFWSLYAHVVRQALVVLRPCAGHQTQVTMTRRGSHALPLLSLVDGLRALSNRLRVQVVRTLSRVVSRENALVQRFRYAQRTSRCFRRKPARGGTYLKWESSRINHWWSHALLRHHPLAAEPFQRRALVHSLTIHALR